MFNVDFNRKVSLSTDSSEFIISEKDADGWSNSRTEISVLEMLREEERLSSLMSQARLAIFLRISLPLNFKQKTSTRKVSSEGFETTTSPNSYIYKYHVFIPHPAGTICSVITSDGSRSVSCRSNYT